MDQKVHHIVSGEGQSLHLVRSPELERQRVRHGLGEKQGHDNDVCEFCHIQQPVHPPAVEPSTAPSQVACHSRFLHGEEEKPCFSPLSLAGRRLEGSGLDRICRCVYVCVCVHMCVLGVTTLVTDICVCGQSRCM